MDKFNSGVYNAILKAKPIATEAYELATKAKEVALDVREKIKQIEEQRKTKKVKLEDTLRKELNEAYLTIIFSFFGLFFIIMSIIKWNIGFYLWGAVFSGISGITEPFSIPTEGEQDIFGVFF